MLTAARNHINLLRQYFLFNLKCSLQYRTSFIIQVIGMIINNSSFLFFWWVIYQNVSNIKGYTFSDVLILWGLASSTYGITYIIFGNGNELSNLIVTGGLDSYLLQPKDIIINACASRTQVSAWGDLIFGFILFFLSGKFSALNFFLFILFTVVGGLIFFSTILAINSLALFLGNIEGTKRLVEMFFLTFATYPEGLFGKYLRIVFYTFLPVGFMVYLPVGIMANFSVLRTFVVLIAATIALMLSYTLFYKGLKRYESGNLMENKL
jgi:ABC-2 type transport system permease protein